MKKNKLQEIQKQQKLLLKIKSYYPLAVSKLWTPYCHRWSGSGPNDERAEGCAKPMTHLGNGLYECKTCNITETRTSQRDAILNMGSEAHLIGGGNRAGKTQLGAMFAVAVAAGSREWWVQQWLLLNDLPCDLIQPDPSTVWCVSLSFGDSLEYLRPKLDQYLPVGTTRTRWSSQDRAIAKLPNGGRLVCMSNDQGRAKFQGSAVQLVWIDEEGHEDVFEECLLRTVDCQGQVLITATPLNGISWMYDRFVELDLSGFSRCKISGLDNPYVSSRKLYRAVQHMSEASQRTRLFGDFASQDGLIYDEFDQAKHVIEPFDIPPNATVYRTIDFGTRNPFACLWIYHDVQGVHGRDDCLYIFQEYYRAGQTTIEAGRQIQRMTTHKVSWTVADSASRDGRLLLARELRMTTKPSPKELGMLSMINLVKDRLHIHEDGEPRLLFFKGKCTNTIKEIRKYRWSKSIKEQPTKQDDHALDALRYAVGFLSRYAMMQM